MSPTRILDREAPLPPPVRPRPGMRVVVVVWACVLIALAASLLADWPPQLRRWLTVHVAQWLEGRSLGASAALALLWTLGVSFVMVAVHEGGHVLAGLAAGFRFRSIRAGPLQIERPFRASLQLGLATAFSGVAVMLPRTTDGLRGRGAVMLAGGPLANILSGGLVLALPFAREFPAVVFVLQSIGNGLSDLLPYRCRFGVSDGSFLWASLRHPARAARWLATMRLQSDIRDGVLPESLPADFLARAVAVRDDSIDTVMAHALAFLAAFHRHDDAEAGRWLETCLAFAGQAPTPLREALISEAVVFQARRRKRPDLAERWQAELPPAPSLPWLRPRGAAAILEARGDLTAAAAKLEECQRTIAAVPDAAPRAIALRLLDRWQSELRR